LIAAGEFAVNFTLIVHVPLLPPSIPVHVFEESEKLPVGMIETERAPVGPPPVLVTVKVASAELLPIVNDPKSVIMGEICSAPGVIEVPASCATAVPPGVPPTVSVDASGPAVPLVEGANFTPTVHVAFAAIVLVEQLSVLIVKSEPFVPVSIPDVAPPVLVTVNVASVDDVPWTIWRKSFEPGITMSAPGATAAPERITVALPPGVADTVRSEPGEPARSG
jgi:hypothetical protein